MKKIYRRKIPTLLYHYVLYLIGIFTLLFIISRFIHNSTILVGIAGLLFLWITVHTVFQSKMKIVVDEKTLTFIEGKKVSRYDLESYQLKSKITNNTKYHLIICQGNKICRQYDCSFIGYNQYLEFLEDLKLIGDGQEVIKIKTKHEGE